MLMVLVLGYFGGLAITVLAIALRAIMRIS
jgi:hypothetical protein